MSKFHPDDCVHTTTVDGMFWLNCSRHGTHYGMCCECYAETMKDDMLKHKYFSYEKLQHMTEESVFLEIEQYAEFLKQLYK